MQAWGQLTNSICASGYGSAGVSLGQKDQTQIKKLDCKRLSVPADFALQGQCLQCVI